MADTSETSATNPTRTSNITRTLRKMLVTVVAMVLMWAAFKYVVAPALFKEAQFTQAPTNVVQPVAEAISEPEITAQATPIISPEIETRLSAVEAEIAALKTQPAITPNTIDNSALEARIAALEAEIAAQKTAPAQAQLSEEKFAEMQSNIAAIKTEQQQKITALLLLNTLRDAVQNGAPYASELFALKTAQPTLSEALVPLEESADVGIATLDELKKQFENTLNPALQTKKTDAGFMDNLGSLVRIRKVGEMQKGGDDESIIARAEAALAQGKIAAATAEIETLSPATLPAFLNWLARAKAKTTAQKNLSQLQTELLAVPEKARP